MSHEGERPSPTLPALEGELADDVAETMQALGSATRLRILARVHQEPASVNELAAMLGVDPSAVSHQLRQLRHLNLVRGTRRGNKVFYRLHDDHVAVLLAEAVGHVRLDQLNRTLEHLNAPAASPAGEPSPTPTAGEPARR